MFDVRAPHVGPVAQRLEQGTQIQERLFAQIFAVLRAIADTRYLGKSAGFRDC